MDIRINQPLWLVLLLPIALYMAYSWKASGMRFIRKETILFALRCMTVFTLVLALASPYLTLRVEEEQVLFVVDRSFSFAGAGDVTDKWLTESLESRQAHQSVGIYSFAESFRTEVQLTEAEVAVPAINPMEVEDETDIAKALDMAAALADQNRATRIVLFSDGQETIGSVEALLPKYSKTDGRITIDTVLVDRLVPADASISIFETPKSAYEGERQLLQVEVESSTRTSGELLIYRNDQEIIKETITLEPGKNQFAFRTAAQGSGLLKYEAKLIVQDDGFLENNRMLSVTMMEHSPRVLIVQTDWNSSAIPTLLDQSAIQVDVVDAQNLPENLSGYLAYGAIIFDNVPGYIVGEQKMQVIEQAVKNFGIGFMMVGGEESFGLGGYFKSPIERLLPVEMEVKGKEQLPSLGLVIVMDRSGSMVGSKIVLAREAAARSVELLREDDTFGFTAFDEQIWEVIPIGALIDKKKAVDQILSVPVGGGTNIFPGVTKAYEDLTDLKLQRKHIILLTDGQSSMPSGYEDTIADGKKNNITLTTVAIGSDADRGLLESLAESGGGRFYDVIDESTIPSILTRETSMLTRTYIEDNPFYMILGGIPEWDSLFSEGIPQMNAYIATTPKNTAKIIGKSHKEDPVLAEWMYGLGRTVAFTSDSAGRWSGDFARWPGYPDFWNTAVARLLPSYADVPYLITHERGGTYTVTDSSRKAAFLDIAVVDEAGQEVSFKTEPLAPGKVRVTVDAKPGLVFFSVVDDQGGLFEAGVSVPYSDEYKPTAPNQALLSEIAQRTGGKVLESTEEVFREQPYQSDEKLPISQWLLLAAMLLFFIDITLRRFGMFKGFGGKRVRQPELKTNSSAQDSIAELLKAKKKR